MSAQLGLFGPLDETPLSPERIGRIYQIIMSAAGREFYITRMSDASRARQYAAVLQARSRNTYHVREVSHRRSA